MIIQLAKKIIFLLSFLLILPSCDQKKYSLYDMPGFDLGTRPDLINHSAIKKIPPNFRSNQVPFISQEGYDSQFQNKNIPYYDQYYGSYNYKPSSGSYEDPYDFQSQNNLTAPYYDQERYYSLPQIYQNIEYNQNL